MEGTENNNRLENKLSAEPQSQRHPHFESMCVRWKGTDDPYPGGDAIVLLPAG